MADVIIKINGDVKNFSDALEKAKKQTEDLSEGLTSIAKVSGIAFAALTAEIGVAVKAFAESEAAGRKLTVALQNQGIYSKRLEQDYKDQAAALQDLTGVDDDAIVASQALLQSMIGQMPVTQELSQAILDLSAAKDIDLQSATTLIGKGIEGQTTALKKLGIEVDEHLTKEQRTAQILEQVTQKFAGQAAAANQGLGGIKGLTSAFGDLQEEIGARFAPIISSAIKKMTEFTIAVKNNQPLVDMGAKLLGAGAAVAALVAALSTAGIAIVSAKAIIAALGLSIGAISLPIALVTAAVVALGAAFGASFAKSMQSPSELLEREAAAMRKTVEQLQKSAEGGAGFSMFKKEDLELAKAQLADLEERLRKVNSQASSKGQDPALADAAKKREQEQRAEEARERAALRAHQEQMLLEMNNASAETIAFKKQEAELLKQIEDEKNAGIRDQLRAQLEEVRRLEAEHEELNQGYRNEQFQAQLATNEEYQALSHEQKMRFLQENRNLLLEGINDADITERNAAKKKAQDQIKAHNEYLENQRKFGTAYAAINSFMHSEVYQGTKQAAGELAALQQSSNSTLKGIGKAAAIANIIIKTGESAMNIFAGFSTIPFIGPALGVAGAAAAVAFGAEQVGRVTAAATGGVITGGMPGVDSVAALLQQGELVSPRQNFEETIGSVRAAREAEKILPGLAAASGQGGEESGGGGRGYAEVVLSLKGELMDWIDAQVIERRRINISTI